MVKVLSSSSSMPITAPWDTEWGSEAETFNLCSHSLSSSLFKTCNLAGREGEREREVSREKGGAQQGKKEKRGKK